MSTRLLRCAAALSLPLMAACERDAQQLRSFGGPTMGSTYEVKFAAAASTEHVRDLVERELAAFDAAFSNWRDDSEIARVNAHRSTEPVEVSARFAAVLQLALRIAAATDGAYDPTLKPLSDLYRQARHDPDAGLSAAALAAARQRVGHELVSLDGRLLRKARADVQLDLDGVVAGAAADAIGERLRAAGVTSFYLQITGEVLCNGVKPGGEPWRIGVVDPSSDEGAQQAVVALPLRDAALCSSGDYRNAVVVDGEVVHHVFDPRTGENPTHGVVSASVVASSCAVADALGTALMVLGPAEARQRWVELRALGARGALLLEHGGERGWQRTEIDWPEDA